MIKEPKRIGSNLDLKGIVIHQVFKEAGDRRVSFKKASSLLTVSDKEKLFVGKLNKVYYRKSSPNYGIFGGTNPIFRDLLNSYLDSGNLYEFSVSATEEYKTVLESTISATGGFLIFVDFINSDNSHRYMLVLTTNNKDGYVVRETDLTLKDIKNLDLSKVDVACMINVSKWKEIEQGIDNESKTYLSFVKGNKNISYYFMDFIDCDNKTTNTESTKRLTNAIDAYTKEKNFDRELRIKKRNEIYQYCDTCMKERKEINLSAISALMDIENPDDFLEFAAEEKYGVSDVIKGDKALLKKMKYVVYKDKNFTVEFDTNLLGKDIVYNKQKNELTFKKLPQELIDQIPL